MPASCFQVVVVGLLFLIAAAFFPPILLVLPLALFGVLILGLVAGLKGIGGLFSSDSRRSRRPHLSDAILEADRSTAVTKSISSPRSSRRNPRYVAPRPAIEAEYQRTLQKEQNEIVRLAGLEFTALVNRALEGGMKSESVVSVFRQFHSIDFTISDGKVNVTEDALARVAPFLPQIAAALDEADRLTAG